MTPANPLNGHNLYHDVAVYSDLGHHRAGGQVDRATTAWLAEALAQAGLETHTQPIGFPQFHLDGWRLSIQGREVESFPVWYPTATAPGGINGRLAPWRDERREDVAGRIALADFGSSLGVTAAHEETVHRVHAAGGLGLVGLANTFSGLPDGRTRGVTVNELPGAPQPWPLPLLQAGSQDRAVLTAAAETGAEAQLEIRGLWDENSASLNVIASTGGQGPLIVVSTPHTGWFNCAAERGGGIAIFLGLARWAVQANTKARFLFVATAAHELGGLGMSRFMAQGAPPPGEVGLWLHLGASVAAWKFAGPEDGLANLGRVEETRNIMSTPALAPLVHKRFAGLEGLRQNVHSSTTQAGGELSLLIREGYPAFGVFGLHRFFHTWRDTKETTSTELLGPLAEAIAGAFNGFVEGWRV